MNYAEELHQIGLLREAGKFAEAQAAIHTLRAIAQEEEQVDILVALAQEEASVFKHLYWQTQQGKYLENAWNSLESVTQYVTDSTRAAFAFWQGEIMLLQQKFTIAVEAFQTALDSLSPSDWHTGDFLYHLGQAQYLTGQKQQGLENVYQGITDIQKRHADIPEYMYKVWLSGGYLRLAQLLKLEKRESEAQEAWELARDCIEADDRLILRRGHLSKVRQFLDQRDPQISDLL